MTNGLLADVYGVGSYDNGVYSSSGSSTTTPSSTTSTTTPSGQTQLSQSTSQPRTTAVPPSTSTSSWGLWIAIIVTAVAITGLIFIVLRIRRRRNNQTDQYNKTDQSL